MGISDKETTKQLLQWISNQHLDILHDDVRAILSMVVLAQDETTLKINTAKLQRYLEYTLKVTLETPFLKEASICVPYKTKRINNGEVIVETNSSNKNMLDIPNDQLARIVKGIVWRDEHFAGSTLKSISKKYQHGEYYVHRCIHESFDFLSR